MSRRNLIMRRCCWPGAVLGDGRCALPRALPEPQDAGEGAQWCWKKAAEGCAGAVEPQGSLLHWPLVL
jgi:hypothetical protein